MRQLEAKVSELESIVGASERDRREAQRLVEQTTADKAEATQMLEAAEARATSCSSLQRRGATHPPDSTGR